MSGHTFDKKTLYHSNLRDLCKERGGNVVVMLNANPIKSQYAGKPPFVPFFIEGDKKCNGDCCAKDTAEWRSYTYQVENDQCGQAIQRTAKKMWVRMTVVGGGDDADLVFERVEGGPLTSHEIARSHGGSAPSHGYGTLAEDLMRSLETSRLIHLWWSETFPGEELTESIRAIANALHIQAQRDGWDKPLHEDIETPQQVELGGAPSDEELQALLDRAAITPQQRKDIQEAIADGMDQARRITVGTWLEQKVQESADADMPLFEHTAPNV